MGVSVVAQASVLRPDVHLPVDGLLLHACVM